MTHRYAPLLLALAAVWGASYLFIKVAVEDGIEPAPMMAARTLGAGLLLFAYVVWSMGRRRAVAELRRFWKPCAVLGMINAAVPFWLVAWGEKHIDSGVAAVVQANVPLFVLLLGIKWDPRARVTSARAAGIGLGLAGVALLAGGNPTGGWWAFAGVLALTGSSLAYASAGLFGQHHAERAPGPILATGSMLAATVYLLPFGLVQMPGHVPSLEASLSIAALTVLGTALAQLILFRMLRLHGSAKVSLVTYLMPGFALLYGAVLLDEPITAVVVGGLALILAGVALASGAARLPRRAVTVRP